ncbi:hypothetical protein KEM52_002926, partial [Ascosphaera acerosa]
QRATCLTPPSGSCPVCPSRRTTASVPRRVSCAACLFGSWTSLCVPPLTSPAPRPALSGCIRPRAAWGTGWSPALRRRHLRSPFHHPFSGLR